MNKNGTGEVIPQRTSKYILINIILCAPITASAPRHIL